MPAVGEAQKPKAKRDAGNVFLDFLWILPKV